MGDLTTALFEYGVFMFGILIDFVLNGISGRSTRRTRAVKKCIVAEDYSFLADKLARLRYSDARAGNGSLIKGYFKHNFSPGNMTILVASLSVLFAGAFFRPMLVVSGFIFATFVSRMYQKHVRLQLGVDLGVFGTVICAALYGPFAGAICGVIAYTLSVFYTDEDAKYLPAVFLGIAIVGFVAGSVALNPANVAAWGVGLTVLYDTVTGAIFLYAYRSNILSCVIFSVTHVWFNYVVFSSLGVIALNAFL